MCNAWIWKMETSFLDRSLLGHDFLGRTRRSVDIWYNDCWLIEIDTRLVVGTERRS
jgi:hypothetical protein